jgi:hypothetical protein
MGGIARRAAGRFERRELRIYVVAQAVAFWGLILLSWLLYPAENRYHITTHTFSFLGSFEPKHNPDTWWVFSLAMLFWSVSAVPLVLYIRRRFETVSKWGARVGAGCFLVGCLGIALVALFPDSPKVLYGDTRWTEVHEKAAILVAAGFFFGILVHGGLLLAHWLGAGRRRERRVFPVLPLLAPYAVWAAMTTAAAANQITWALRYAAMKEEAAATGASIGSSWGESLGTFYAFPLWENLVIYTLYLFLAWFVLALPVHADRE